MRSSPSASLARAWRKTLLVDADLRNPAIHRQFDLRLDPGMSEVLRGEAELEDAIRPTPVSRLPPDATARIGARLASTAVTVISFGRSRCTAPSIAAASFVIGTPAAILCCRASRR